VVVKLRPAASIRGRVVRANGQPVKGFSLYIQPMSQGGGIPQGEREFQGDRFELRDVPAAPVAVMAWTTDGARGETQVTPTYDTPAEVVLTLKSTAGLRGRVVDEATGEPIADAFVFIEGERPFNEESGPDGRFLIERLAPGEHTLRISSGSFRRAVRAVTLVEGQVLDVGDIALAAPSTRSGTIGVFVNQNGNELVLFQVIPGSPAERAGLKMGDTLLAVEGAPVTNGQEANQRLTGAPGSPVVLKVRRAGTEQTVSVVRAP
jgi:membrane-associated protease RseP (regulator of RpoE activity)